MRRSLLVFSPALIMIATRTRLARAFVREGSCFVRRNRLAVAKERNSHFDGISPASFYQQRLLATEVAKEAQREANSAEHVVPNHKPSLQRSDSTASTDSSLSTDSSKSSRRSRTSFQWWRRAAATAAATTGFVSQAVSSLWIDREQITRTWIPLAQSVTDFLEKSGLRDELASTLLKRQLISNIILLYRIQSTELSKERRKLVQSQDSDRLMQHIPSHDEAYG
jgi:hypothetical protein